MTPFAFVVALAAIVGTIAHAAHEMEMPMETPEPKCYDSGEKCAGAAGYTYHKYMPCCDAGDACVEKPELGWGKFCMPKTYKPKYTEPTPTEPEKCYENGVKCMGAAGYPSYQYKPCCDKKAKCVSDPALGWGKFCKLDSSPAPAPGKKYEAEDPEPAEPEKKCYSNGVKCMGAAGYPHYQYKPCCDSSAKCVENPKLGWGKFCMVDAYKAPPSPKPDPYAEPVAPTPAKCYENGVKCKGAAGYPHYQYKPCCDAKAKCVTNAELGWGKFCMVEEPKYAEEPKYEEEPKYSKPEPSPMPAKCYANGIKCMGAPGYPHYQYKPCCDASAKCVSNPKLGWGKFCMVSEYPKDVVVVDPSEPEYPYKDEPVVVVGDYKPEVQCLKEGVTCKASTECCSGDCKKGSWYGSPSKCAGPPKVSPPKSEPEKCYKSFTEECAADGPECCEEGHKCVDVVSFGGMRCVPAPATNRPKRQIMQYDGFASDEFSFVLSPETAGERIKEIKIITDDSAIITSSSHSMTGMNCSVYLEAGNDVGPADFVVSVKTFERSEPYYFPYTLDVLGMSLSDGKGRILSGKQGAGLTCKAHESTSLTAKAYSGDGKFVDLSECSVEVHDDGKYALTADDVVKNGNTVVVHPHHHSGKATIHLEHPGVILDGESCFTTIVVVVH